MGDKSPKSIKKKNEQRQSKSIRVKQRKQQLSASVPEGFGNKTKR